MKAIDPGCHASGALERVRYFSRQLVTPEDLNDQVQYFVEKLRRHNRFVHGFGIACGLEVTRRGNDPDAPGYDVTIHPGHALTPCGDEVHVAAPIDLDLTKVVRPSTSNCPPTHAELTGRVAYLALRPIDCPTRPVRVQSASCGCGDAPCELSRVREGFEHGLLTQEPAVYLERRLRYSKLRKDPQRVPPPCMGCPADDWVVISALTLSSDRIEVQPNLSYVLPSVLATLMVASSI